MAKETAPVSAPAPLALDPVVKTLSVSFDKKAKDAGRSCEIVASFDFTGLSLEDLVEKAMRSVVIDFQRALRTAPTEEALAAFCASGTEGEPLVIPVAEAGHSPWPSERKSKDPVKTAQTAVAKMTEEQKAELIKMLQG